LVLYFFGHELKIGEIRYFYYNTFPYTLLINLLIEYKISRRYAYFLYNPIISHKNKTANDVGNPGPGLGQAQTYGGVKPVNGSATPIHI
jgi:hypothetical protein